MVTPSKVLQPLRLLLLTAVLVRADPTTRRIWVDCDNSAGVAGVRDPDDALALIQLIHSPETHIVGISTVFGNAPVLSSTRATENLLQIAQLELPVVTGAGSSKDSAGAAVAADEIAAAVRAAHTTIVALGPLTNIAALIGRHPQLVHRVTEIVWVGGRRVGQLFRVGTFNNKTLADMNFEKDTTAAAAVLASGIPLVLAPFELSSQLQMHQTHLNGISGSSPTADFVDQQARPWLQFWEQTWRVPYFFPFDCLAVMYLTAPQLLRCSAAGAQITRGDSDQVIMEIANRKEGDSTVHGFGAATKLYFHVDILPESTAGSIKYCHHLVDAASARALVLTRLVGKIKTEL